MTQMHTLLAATDLSGPARHAVMRAAMLASESGARSAVTHVVSRGGLEQLRHLLGSGDEAVVERLIEDARDRVRQVAIDTGEPFGVTADVRVAAGSVLQELVSHTDALDAELLVMGARGSSFAHEMLLGTTTERVLR